MENILEVADLNVSFDTAGGRFHALKNVALQVPKGKIVGIVGESGSGKSTLISAVNGLMAENANIDSGSIQFAGEQLLEKSAKQMRGLMGDRIAMIFQEPMTTLNPVMKIGRQMIDIQFREKLSKQEKRTRAIQALRSVGIPQPEQRLNRYPYEFSGGQLQRIAIAMALMSEPDLLIADEPTTALDATMEVQIIELLQALQQDIGCSMMFISHHLGVVGALCDYVVVMYMGEVVEQGTAHEVFSNPQHPYTRKLLECDPARIKEKTRHLPTMNDDGDQDIRIPENTHIANSITGDKQQAYAGNLLEIDQVKVRFTIKSLLDRILDRSSPYLHAVKGVSINVQAGETVAIVGESGSGKTTVAQTVLGLVDAWSGSVRFKGQELLGLSGKDYMPYRRDIVMMFQDPVSSLSPRMTIGEQVVEPLQVHGVKVADLAAEARKLLKMVGLPESFVSRYPHQLSGGQARRVGVARALALAPKLIIADEPTAGLDVSVQGEILNLLRHLQEDLNIAILVITHNLNVVRHVADRMVIMYMGEIIEEGDTETIFATPQQEYTRTLLAANVHPEP